MITNIYSVALKKPPRMVNSLASGQGLLAAWASSFGGIVGDDENTYHLALHSATHGWRAYRWNEQYGLPLRALPISENIVWVQTMTSPARLLRIEHNGRAVVAVSTETAFLLNADVLSCLVRSKTGDALQLRLKNNGLLSPANRIRFYALWAHYLDDGMIVIGSNNALDLLDQSGKVVYTRRKGWFSYYRPFITQYVDDHLYYTDDPRRGWRKTTILHACREHSVNNECNPVFFAVVEGVCYIATASRNEKYCTVRLYRSSEKSPSNTEYLGQIRAENIDRNNIAWYDGMICIANRSSISIESRAHQSGNNDFIVWDITSDMFYEDIPRRMPIAKLASRASQIRIPNIWGNGMQPS